jgi:hypothetical protein
MNSPKICNAKLLNRDVYCQSPPLSGKRRCARHGGKSTGPRTPDGMAHVAERMSQGRRRWIARMRAEGLPLPFAGFKPKGSGKTREVREAEAQTRRSERFLYGESKRQVEAARIAVLTMRAVLPRYVRQDHFDVPGNVSEAYHALRAFEELQAMPAEGPFAAQLQTAKGKAFAAVVPIIKAATGHAIKEAIQRQRREEQDAQHEWVFQALRNPPGRPESAAKLQSSGEPAVDGPGASGPLPAAYSGPDIAPAPRTPAHEPEAVPVIQPDFAARCEANVRRRRKLAPAGEGEPYGRHYAFTASGIRYLTSRRTR